MEQQQSALTNVSSLLLSPADLLMVVPRLLSKAGALGEHIDSVYSKFRFGGSVIAEPTIANLTNATTATASRKFIQESIAATPSPQLALQEDMNLFQALKNVGSFFSYITSKWAIATFSIAIILNRTYFYASSRVPLSFDRFHLRLALYILPLLLFVYRIQGVLQAIHCQLNPDWSSIQYGAPGRQLDTDFAGEGGFLWRASSALLFWGDVEDSCKAVNMLPPAPGATRSAGSLALLWPLFISLGLGQFVETLSCALQGRHPVPEVGMTIFEHSLAFAEAEAVVSRPLTLESTRFFKPQTVFTPDSTNLTLTRSAVSSFANVPPEVLLIALISSVSHFSSNFLAIIGFRARFRLVTTGIWGAAYMTTFAWSLYRFATNDFTSDPQVGFLRFPTVCMVGFIPHLVIIAGIVCCGVIYLLALGITILNPPPGQPDHTWRERFATAYNNLHANIHLSAITPLTVSWNEDFYTAILKVGLTVLTAASEAVYLNEGMRVNVYPSTWLERQRYSETISRRRQDGVQSHRGVVNEARSQPASGYARERKTKGADTSTSETMAALGQGEHGVGLAHRQGRWALTVQFTRGILTLLLFAQARLLLAIMQKLHIAYRPHWLVRLTESRMTEESKRHQGNLAQAQEQTVAVRRPDIRFDLETFVRQRVRISGAYDEFNPQESEEIVSQTVYDWWKDGRELGDVDRSGDYAPSSIDDEDTTSVVSFSTTSDAGVWSDVEDEGQRTPTQTSYRYSRESTPVHDNALDLARLSHLLNPQSKEDRDEARMLGRHLQSSNVLTRSQYRKLLQSNDVKFLASSQYRAPGASALSAEDEEQVLEDFILDRRDAAKKSNAGTWDSGADGMGAEGPQCVVCQISPRAVLVWPCGCLSLCDECRVGLASKNYTTCVCCRTNVTAYSRLFVP
ncbi:ubiquitin-protein ligase-like protein [Bimuria novae-zelandiae CBS 107.79]|uniref:Ubiquitin-protein ligase-like protein n=1 Tax=Bimuria novae-zelandiae CBS 107.79 TaxID=1447943 RepID=A0A6A5UMF2_9PLEO|nr:ubiquitin-protein ligase-like protein [Bimuria novae-zelandiae CBS 107.79]